MTTYAEMINSQRGACPWCGEPGGPHQTRACRRGYNRAERERKARKATHVFIACGHVWESERQYPRRKVVRSSNGIDYLECGHEWHGCGAGRGIITGRHCHECGSIYPKYQQEAWDAFYAEHPGWTCDPGSARKVPE